MIFKDLKIFSQNVQKNNLIVNTILELKVDLTGLPSLSLQKWKVTILG